MTRIADGQMLSVCAVGLLQMVCWLHEQEEDGEEEEEEEEEDDGDPLSVGRETLEIVWEQSELTKSMPFVEPATEASEAILEYEIKGRVASSVDWDERNTIYMQGMQTQLDVGKPTSKSYYILAFLAGINASMGLILRVATADRTFDSVMGETTFDSVVVVSCFAVTFISSYYVYYTLFCTAFQWYTVLTFLTQMAQVLVIEGAMHAHLPCCANCFPILSVLSAFHSSKSPCTVPANLLPLHRLIYIHVKLLQILTCAMKATWKLGIVRANF